MFNPPVLATPVGPQAQSPRNCQRQGKTDCEINTTQHKPSISEKTQGETGETAVFGNIFSLPIAFLWVFWTHRLLSFGSSRRWQVLVFLRGLKFASSADVRKRDESDDVQTSDATKDTRRVVFCFFFQVPLPFLKDCHFFFLKFVELSFHGVPDFSGSFDSIVERTLFMARGRRSWVKSLVKPHRLIRKTTVGWSNCPKKATSGFVLTSNSTPSQHVGSFWERTKRLMLKNTKNKGENRYCQRKTPVESRICHVPLVVWEFIL